LIGRPELRTAVQALIRPAAEYVAAQVHHTTPRFSGVGEIVRELETERGRQARPFRLTVTEVGVAGVIWHRLTTDHMLISTRFRDDEPAVVDVPTPAGVTPREIGAPATATLLPIVGVTHGK
jgi:hypothetical protein